MRILVSIFLLAAILIGGCSPPDKEVVIKDAIDTSTIRQINKPIDDDAVTLEEPVWTKRLNADDVIDTGGLKLKVNDFFIRDMEPYSIGLSVELLEGSVKNLRLSPFSFVFKAKDGTQIDGSDFVFAEGSNGEWISEGELPFKLKTFYKVDKTKLDTFKTFTMQISVSDLEKTKITVHKDVQLNYED
ncbi:hypothetical protein [Bacillus altitudinis]|uniref:hypothetical protein n=1 Tax=Bacillus altitudinis TaxID=293387 RepID=UPI00064C6FE8|nr:hypothetical protein [Bacillus altitudinis]KLV24737.1 hypothetical protein ABW03_03390 [Bacillus altitudinis]